MMNLSKSVLLLTSKIPRGKVSTYKEIARALGNPRLARAVGNALNGNKKPVEIPCHRVVCSDGRVGGYKWGVEKKIRLLGGEGIGVSGGKVEMLDEVFFRLVP